MQTIRLRKPSVSATTPDVAPATSVPQYLSCGVVAARSVRTSSGRGNLRTGRSVIRRELAVMSGGIQECFRI
eukprot:6206994-Pleurochrysis_carterae.AAC.5